MNISTIAIGDELLLGQVTDTNTGFIARTIAPRGWGVSYAQIVADDADEISKAIDRAFKAADVVITTGGLGPTKDDITKLTLMRYFGGELIMDATVEANVARIFNAKNLPLNDLTRAQALVPSSCTVIQNLVGTAPIMWFEKEGKVLVSMPGVPSETEHMFAEAVFPRLIERFTSSSATLHHSLTLYGIGESHLAEHLSAWESALPSSLHLAYLPNAGIITLRLDCTASTQAESERLLNRYTSELQSLTSQWLVANGNLTPAEILLAKLKQNSLTVATAESCTGGNIAHLITLIPGSSEAMLGGVVSYANSVKTGVLGVDPTDIATQGAVSEPVAQAMAQGVRGALRADIGIATTGIAGPGGAVEGKPVGTVWIAVSTSAGTIAKEHHFSGSRTQIINRASTAALMMALKYIS